jgi:hypothetical protein
VQGLATLPCISANTLLSRTLLFGTRSLRLTIAFGVDGCSIMSSSSSTFVWSLFPLVGYGVLGRNACSGIRLLRCAVGCTTVCSWSIRDVIIGTMVSESEDELLSRIVSGHGPEIRLLFEDLGQA